MLDTCSKVWTIRDLLETLPSPTTAELEAPHYNGSVLTETRNNAALVTTANQRHMTDEAWQIMEGLGHFGYTLYPEGTDVRKIVTRHETRPNILVVQDKREWTKKGDIPFRNVDFLRGRDKIFKLTILKDSHQRPTFHSHSAWEMEVHAWICYYNPAIVNHLAPYTRRKHLVRTWHTVRQEHIPPFRRAAHRADAIITGAVSSAYPWRRMLMSKLSGTDVAVAKHPGYHANGCITDAFLSLLSNYKVSICTASIYGYALRKIIESVVAGCVVITDLPQDEQLPLIEASIIRTRPGTSANDVRELIRAAVDNYDEARQYNQAREAAAFYDHVGMTARLAMEIEELRKTYER